MRIEVYGITLGKDPFHSFIMTAQYNVTTPKINFSHHFFLPSVVFPTLVYTHTRNEGVEDFFKLPSKKGKHLNHLFIFQAKWVLFPRYYHNAFINYNL